MKKEENTITVVVKIVTAFVTVQLTATSKLFDARKIENFWLFFQPLSYLSSWSVENLGQMLNTLHHLIQDLKKCAMHHILQIWHQGITINFQI